MAPAQSAVQEYVETELRAEQTPDGTQQTLIIEKVVTATGRVLSRRQTVSDNPRNRMFADSPAVCAHEGHREGFVKHDRREALDQGRNDFRHYMFFPYSVDNARLNDGGRPQQQWLMCAAGGTDSDNGSRTGMSGPGVYFKDRGTTYKLGHAWREGGHPSRTPSTLVSRSRRSTSTSRPALPRLPRARCEARPGPRSTPTSTCTPATEPTDGGKPTAPPTAPVPGGATAGRVQWSRGCGSSRRTSR